MSSEVLDSVKKTIQGRTTSHLYGVFILSFIAINWEFFYTATLVSEEIILNKTDLMRHEYLSREFVNITDLSFYLYRIILPVLTTWFVIWIAPQHILIRAFKKEEEYKTSKKIIVIEEEKKVEIKQKELQEFNIETLLVTEEKIQKEAEVKTAEETEWERGFNEFKTTDVFEKFYTIIESVYEYRGVIKDDYSNFVIPTDVLVYSHTNGLITLDENKKKIELTDKGKYFIRQHILNEKDE